MATFNWNQFAVGGAQRPDSFSGLDPTFNSALQALFTAAPPEIQQSLRVTSGFRSPEKQAELWQNALNKYGDPEIADNWVAPPGRSNHNHGRAVDLKYLSPAATEWAHANAEKFGLHFPLANENWHVEPLGSRGKGSAPASGSSTVSRMMSPTPMAQQTGQVQPNAQNIQQVQRALLGDILAPRAPVTPDFSTVVQNYRARQEREQESKEAEAQRKAALFSGLGAHFG